MIFGLQSKFCNVVLNFNVAFTRYFHAEKVILASIWHNLRVTSALRPLPYTPNRREVKLKFAIPTLLPTTRRKQNIYLGEIYAWEFVEYYSIDQKLFRRVLQCFLPRAIKRIPGSRLGARTCLLAILRDTNCTTYHIKALHNGLTYSS